MFFVDANGTFYCRLLFMLTILFNVLFKVGDKQVAIGCHYYHGVGHSGSCGLPEVLPKMSKLI